MATVKSIDVALRANTTEFEAGMRRGVGSNELFEASNKRVMASMDKAWHLFNKGAIQIDEYNKKIAAGEKDLEAIKMGFTGMAGATERAHATLRSLETETDRYHAKLRELDALLKLDKLTQEQYAAAVAHTTAEFRKSQPVLQQTQTKFQKITASLMPFIAAGGTAAVVHRALSVASNTARSAIHKLSDTFENVDSANKAAISIGIATGELMKLRFAIGEVAGVSAEGVDAALKKMNLEISQAATTGKGATEMINALGLSVEKLAAMSPDKAFMVITDAISNLKGAGDKANATMAIFGKSGMDLLPIFQNGAAALKDSADFAERVGLNLSNIDATAMEMALDTVNRMKTQLEGVAIQVGAVLGKELTVLGNAIMTVAGDGKSGVESLSESFRGLSRSVAIFLDQTTPILKFFKKLGDSTPVGQLQNYLDKLKKLVVSDEQEAIPGGFLEAVINAEKQFDRQMAEMEKTRQEATKNATIAGGLDTTQDEKAKSKAAADKAAAVAKSKALTEAERRAKQIRDMERDVAGNSSLVKFKHQVEDIDALFKKHLITLEKRNQLVAMAHKTIVQDPANKKEMEERKKRVEEATRFRINSNPMEKFAEEAAKIRKLELAGELTQQQAARATLDARKEAIAALVKLQKEQTVSPKFSLSMPTVPNVKFPQPVIPQPKIPTFNLPQYNSPALSKTQTEFQKWTAEMQTRDGRNAAMTGAGDMTAGMDLRKEAMKVRGEELTRKLEHPFQTFQRTVDELQKLRNVNAISRDTQTQGIIEARKQAFEDLAKMPQFQVKDYKPAALESGTQAAFSAFHENKDGADKAKQQLELQRKIEAHLAKIARGGVVLASAKGRF